MAMDPQELEMMQMLMGGQDPELDMAPEEEMMGMEGSPDMMDPGLEGSPVGMEGQFPPDMMMGMEEPMMQPPQPEMDITDPTPTIGQMLVYMERVMDNQNLRADQVADILGKMANAVSQLSSTRQVQADPEAELELKREEMAIKAQIDIEKLEFERELQMQKMDLERERDELEKQHKHDVHLMEMELKREKHQADIYFKRQQLEDKRVVQQESRAGKMEGEQY